MRSSPPSDSRVALQAWIGLWSYPSCPIATEPAKTDVPRNGAPECPTWYRDGPHPPRSRESVRVFDRRWNEDRPLRRDSEKQPCRRSLQDLVAHLHLRR